MLTYIMQSPLSLSASHKHTCPLHTHHTHTHTTHTSAAIQSLSNKEGTDAPPGSGGGGHTPCVRMQWGGLGTQHLSAITSSAVSKCVRKHRKSEFRLPAQRQLMQKCDNMKSGISVRTGPKEEFRKNKQVFFPPTFMSSLNWSEMVEAFSPAQSPVAFFFSGTM